MQRLGYRITLFALTWAVTTAACAADAEMSPCAEAMPPLSMADCQSCTIGNAIPATGKPMAESDDGPAIISAGWGTRFAQQAAIDEVRIGTAARPFVALRLLYCRWLN